MVNVQFLKVWIVLKNSFGFFGKTLNDNYSVTDGNLMFWNEYTILLFFTENLNLILKVVFNYIAFETFANCERLRRVVGGPCLS